MKYKTKFRKDKNRIIASMYLDFSGFDGIGEDKKEALNDLKLNVKGHIDDLKRFIKDLNNERS